jgi:predicted Fe-S protein YdhL (DUF1289 family)
MTAEQIKELTLDEIVRWIAMHRDDKNAMAVINRLSWMRE